MTREQVLENARACVCGQREQDYGQPEDNFSLIASLWTVYTGCVIDSVDVAMMMALLKIARVKGGKTEDSFIDLAGYAACGGELATNLQLTFEITGKSKDREVRQSEVRIPNWRQNSRS